MPFVYSSTIQQIILPSWVTQRPLEALFLVRVQAGAARFIYSGLDAGAEMQTLPPVTTMERKRRARATTSMLQMELMTAWVSELAAAE